MNDTIFQIGIYRKNDIIKNKLDRNLIIKLLNEYGIINKDEPFFKVLTLSKLKKCRNYLLCNIYYYIKTHKNADKHEENPIFREREEITPFKIYKEKFLIRHPQFTKSHLILKDEARELILFFYNYTEKEKDGFFFDVEKNKIKVSILREFISDYIKNFQLIKEAYINNIINSYNLSYEFILNKGLADIEQNELFIYYDKLIYNYHIEKEKKEYIPQYKKQRKETVFFYN